MVRLADLPDGTRNGIEALECPQFEDKPFTQPVSQSARRISILSSAGLIERGSQPFKRGDSGYRRFSNAVANNDILVSHISINFDRTAAFANIESIFPRNTLQELSEETDIGHLSSTHYSVMGATDPLTMKDEAANLAQELKQDGVNTVVLLPV